MGWLFGGKPFTEEQYVLLDLKYFCTQPLSKKKRQPFIREKSKIGSTGFFKWDFFKKYWVFFFIKIGSVVFAVELWKWRSSLGAGRKLCHFVECFSPDKIYQFKWFFLKSLSIQVCRILNNSFRFHIFRGRVWENAHAPSIPTLRTVVTFSKGWLLSPWVLSALRWRSLSRK